MFRKMLLGIFAVSATVAAAQSPAEFVEKSENIVLGQSITVRSQVMGTDRIINVILPEGYADSHQDYPVLYVLDGGVDQDLIHVAGTTRLNSLWGRSREVIVVGVNSEDRRAELTGPATNSEILAKFPSAGQSAKFRKFLSGEVKPFVESNYRTTGESGLMGESLAGLFVAETWLRDPAAFTRYAAISPSLWWDDEKLTSIAAIGLTDGTDAAPIFFATEDEGEEFAKIIERFLATLSEELPVCHSPQSGTHATIYHAVTPSALQFLFPPSEAPDQQYGFEVTCSKKF